ncbi:MAG: hypothetical protein BWY21_01666 [Parcubacteria group bacterium ADurb.Bin216]|nr:MAG: hypothetical protein BWY21_01666 [Parcubacteria group bacterium ADurb.Bin216]
MANPDNLTAAQLENINKLSIPEIEKALEDISLSIHEQTKISRALITRLNDLTSKSIPGTGVPPPLHQA